MVVWFTSDLQFKTFSFIHIQQNIHINNLYFNDKSPYTTVHVVIGRVSNIILLKDNKNDVSGSDQTLEPTPMTYCTQCSSVQNFARDR